MKQFILLLLTGGALLGAISNWPQFRVSNASGISDSGTFAVLRAGDTLDVVGVNKLGETVRCTPALAGDRIYVRTAEHLWAFGQ